MSTARNEIIPLNSKNCSNLKIWTSKILKNRVHAIDIHALLTYVLSLDIFSQETISESHTWKKTFKNLVTSYRNCY